MKIPRKINPDNLKDSIIQVVFNPGVPPELILGAFSLYLRDYYDFIASAPRRNEIKVKDSGGLFLGQIEKGYFLDKKEQIKVDLGPNTLVFNLYKNYIGWENFFPLIEATISSLFESRIIENVVRVGIRYISQFDSVNLFENLKMDLNLNIPNKSLESTQIRSEYIENGFKIILTLINKIHTPIEPNEESINTSIIDVDVIQIRDDFNNVQVVLETIQKGHIQQKETFFSLLKPEFLESLNPEY